MYICFYKDFNIYQYRYIAVFSIDTPNVQSMTALSPSLSSVGWVKKFCDRLLETSRVQWFEMNCSYQWDLHSPILPYLAIPTYPYHTLIFPCLIPPNHTPIYLSILCHPHWWVLCAGLPEVEESQDISWHSLDMPVKPPRLEGDSKTTYIPTDFFFHINILSLAGLEPVRKRYVGH